MSPTPKTQRMVKTPAVCRWRGCVFLAAALLVFGFVHPRANAAVSEGDVKAAFLYNAAKFVEWPKEAFAGENDPIQVAVLGDEDFAAKLRVLLTDKKAHGRSFEVKKISNAAEAKAFQIVFIPNTEMRRLAQILDATRKSPVLTIGESDQFVDMGGMINILFEDTQLRFEVNADAAEKAKLIISSKFLRLAKRVKR